MGQTEASMAQRASIPEHVVHRAFPAETVLLNLQTGKYHGLNRSGARIFEFIERDGSLATVAQKLSEFYERPLAEMQADVLAFCDDMVGFGLLTLEPA